MGELGPSRETQPAVGSASDLAGNSGCSCVFSSSSFPGSVSSVAVRVATSTLYFLRREDSHISMTGPCPSTVKSRFCSSAPRASRSGSTTHIHRKRVRRPCSARATATRKDSFLVASFTAVKNRTRGCSMLARASTSADGVFGKRGAESSQQFNASVQRATICSTRSGTALTSKIFLCSCSPTFPRCSPRPSARRPLTDSSSKGRNFWKGADRQTSVTSVTTLFPSPPRSRSKRKSTHATTFSWATAESLPWSSNAQRQPRGNCCVLSSNL
mmetsp:Transcript_45889/g.99674  ORF Transcript_45889/g.99674 Transcript_45889/m.99674 type:complete len:271 (-) Transcript_45889:370-1182(-)